MGKRLMLLGALIMGLALPASAQGAFSIAYRVNEAVITHYDIDQRVRLMRALGANGSNMRQAAIDALIDDRLKQEAAASFGASLERAALDTAIENYANQRNLTTQSLLAKLRRAGVQPESFDEFLSVSVIWRNILRSRFGQQANPSEIELNAQLNTYAISSSSTIQLGEIVLPYLERGQNATVALATDIVAQLRGGANFSDLAKQYSRARTADRGGVIGWVSPNRLPAQIGAAIRGLGRGRVADPIFIPSGVVIIKVLDARTVSRQIQVPVNVNLTYAELVIPYTPGGENEAGRLANRVQRSLDGCRGLVAQAADFGTGSGVFGPVSLNSIDTDVGLALARLDPRDSTIMQGSNALRVLVLCDRVSEMSPEGRATLRNQLASQNLGALSEGYLLELRRNSIIERK
ncbi:MAG: peptidylprolyl isomerase [Rhodobacteraceae bacterium]|nr:peptidylprolyl isomerase [Paracoccaceae bacterium]